MTKAKNYSASSRKSLQMHSEELSYMELTSKAGVCFTAGSPQVHHKFIQIMITWRHIPVEGCSSDKRIDLLSTAKTITDLVTSASTLI